MSLFKSNMIGLLCIAVIVAGLMGCGGKGESFEYKDISEIPEGPGLLSGEDGEFTVYDSKKGGAFWKQAKTESPEAAAASKPADAKTPAVTGEAAETKPAITPEEAKEYQEFQEWKKEQKAFREFQQWKRSNTGSAEYQEFREWQEFKTYQEWKKKKGQ